MLELSQGVRGVRFFCADGVSDFVTEEGIITRAQDVTEIIRQKGPIGIGSATASVRGEVVCAAELTFAIGSKEE